MDWQNLDYKGNTGTGNTSKWQSLHLSIPDELKFASELAEFTSVLKVDLSMYWTKSCNI